jgi:flagellar L-ring protein precursor FlgH
MRNHLKKHRRAMGTIGLCGCMAMAMLLFGCAMSPVSQSASPAKNMATPDPAGDAARQAATMRRETETGSLWAENGGSLNEMFANAKARRVGDIVTIRIVENSSATNKATTDTDRDTSMSIGLTGFFNLEDKFPSTSKFFNPFSPVESEYKGKFKGAGTTVRSGDLEAFISARIVQILPNGDFFIEGNREVRVNNENQVITLTGVVRPRDISGDNVIQSTYIADAKISYSGSGIVNDQQRPGWLARLLDNIWPF